MAERDNNRVARAAIAVTAVAVPPHTLTRDEVNTYIGRVFDIDARRAEGVKSKQPPYNGGPLWRIELVSPLWPKQEK
jgi:hypothetical protein